MERTRQVGKHHQSGLASVAEAPSNGPWAQLVQLWLAVTHLTYFLIINLQYKLAVVDFIGQSKLAQQHSEAWEYWSSYPLGWGGVSWTQEGFGEEPEGATQISWKIGLEDPFILVPKY